MVRPAVSVSPLGRGSFLFLQGSGRISAEPTSVPEGQDVEVKADGHDTVRVAVDYGQWIELPVDPSTKKAKFNAPVGAKHLVFSDLQDTQFVVVEVVSISTS